MAKLWQFRQGHLQPGFSKKRANGDQGKFFKNRQKSSPCLKGPKALWRKLNYTLIKMHLKRKDWRIFWRKQRLQKCPNGQVMAIIARSPKTRIFWKSAKGGAREIFQNSPKKEPSFERPKSTLPEMALFSNLYALKLQRLKKLFEANKRLQKCPNGQVMAIKASSPKTRIFWKRAKGGQREIFQRSFKKQPWLKKANSTLAEMALSSN